ncbi:hypothetical protein FDUTEX481_00850 [Tolypothrix sp. PCC 7601]|nr:hypothetical protein FDUTEX481_00850 [Tolypothrix sp. PCC 7601]BAY92096.1 hypothetical protein NIES3275_41280 [Microchaete diplosiphon NIES-3275]
MLYQLCLFPRRIDWESKICLDLNLLSYRAKERVKYLTRSFALVLYSKP